MSFPNLFPYPYRPGQEDIVRLVRDSVRNGRHIVMESGTGTGKTSVALVSALEAVAELEAGVFQHVHRTR